MAEGTKGTRVFAKTYSKENRIFRSWRGDAVRPVPIISSYKNLRAVEEHVPVPSNSPVSSDTTASDSSLYSDNTQFVSLSQHQSSQKERSRSTLCDSSSTPDDRDSEQEVTLKNPNAPYRNDKKVHYSIIIEESDDTNKPEATVRKGSSAISAKKVVRNLPKSSSAPVRNVQKTKMMKDSLQNNNESDQGGLSFFDLDSSSISLIDEDDRNSSEYVSSNQEESTLHNQQCSTKDPRTSLSEENLEISDIEVMRDAPPVGATTKGKGEKKDLASFLKISAVKIFPQKERKLKQTIPQRSHKSKERKNSTLNEVKSAKNIQELSFCDNISHIPAYSSLSSECASGDDSSSTLKGTPGKMPSVTNTLKEIHSNIQRDSPSTMTKQGVNKVNIIRTPKKHNIKQASVCSVPSHVDTQSAKQVSFLRAANEESLYEPGSAVRKDPVPVQLPQLSPSLSILKKAVSSWKLNLQEGNTENLPCKATSTPLSKRKSKYYGPSKMAFSFDVSAVPLPSYDNDDLMVPLPPQKTDISKVSSINKERIQSPSSCISRHETPSKQVKRDSPEPSIPSRPLKRRRFRVVTSSSDTEQEFSNKTAICKSNQHRQKKRLEYRDKGVGPPKCVVTMLPDVHFQKRGNKPTKFSSVPCLDMSFLNNVPEAKNSSLRIPQMSFSTSGFDASSATFAKGHHRLC